MAEIIRDLESWREFNEKHNPLKGLDDKERERFEANLHFNEKGLCGFYYGDVREKLPYSEYKDLMWRFGINIEFGLNPEMIREQLETEVSLRKVRDLLRDQIHFEFLEGYKCAGKGTCTTSMNNACTGNC